MDKQLCTQCSSSEISEEGIYCKVLNRWVGRGSEQHCVIETLEHSTDKDTQTDTQNKTMKKFEDLTCGDRAWKRR